MKKWIFVFLALGLLFSCDNNDDNTNNELIGSWKMVEVFNDIGDGTGNYNPVQTKKTLTFKSDGTVVSNGNLCYSSTEIGNPTAGTYSLVDSTFQSPNCNIEDFKYSFKVEGNILTVYYRCIESCRAKFIKL